MVMHENSQKPAPQIRELAQSIAALQSTISALSSRTESVAAAVNSGRESVNQTIKNGAESMGKSFEASKAGCLNSFLYVAGLICVIFTWYNTHTLSATDRAIAERLTLPESEVLSRDQAILNKLTAHRPLTYEEYVWEAARQRVADTVTRGLKFADESKQGR